MRPASIIIMLLSNIVLANSYLSTDNIEKLEALNIRRAKEAETWDNVKRAKNSLSAEQLADKFCEGAAYCVEIDIETGEIIKRIK